MKTVPGLTAVTVSWYSHRLRWNRRL